jgi:Trk K+ transport system NAD-binding subunit
LKQYGGTVRAIEVVQPKDWELANLPDLLEELLIGDCRQPSVLAQAKIQQCRSILLVTNDERVNTEAALAARLLNPQIRLVVRSDKQNLNQLLSQNLGNFVAFEPNQLTAAAFALAAFGSEILGYFNLEGRWLWVVRHQVKPGDLWCDRFWVKELNSSTRRVLTHNQAGSQMPKQFCQWEAEAILQAGDTLVYVEVRDKLAHFAAKPVNKSKYNLRQLWRETIHNLAGKNFKQKIARLWQFSRQYQTLRVAGLCGITVLILLFCGMVLFRWNYPNLSLREVLNTTTVLLLGGFDNLFGGSLELSFPIPWWLHLFSLGLTVAGTVVVGKC